MTAIYRRGDGGGFSGCGFGAAYAVSRQMVGGALPNRKHNLPKGHLKVVFLVWGLKSQHGRSHCVHNGAHGRRLFWPWLGVLDGAHPFWGAGPDRKLIRSLIRKNRTQQLKPKTS